MFAHSTLIQLCFFWDFCFHNPLCPTCFAGGGRPPVDDGHAVTGCCIVAHDEEIFQPHQEEEALLRGPRGRGCPVCRVWAEGQGPGEGAQGCGGGRCGEIKGTCRKTWYKSTWQREQVRWQDGWLMKPFLMLGDWHLTAFSLTNEHPLLMPLKNNVVISYKWMHTL